MQSSVRHVAGVVPDLPLPWRRRIHGSCGGACHLGGAHRRARLWLALERRALRRAPLVGEARNAVVLHVQHAVFDQRRAGRPDLGEVVVRQREVAGRSGELAERVGHLSVEAVPSQIELLDAAEAGEG